MKDVVLSKTTAHDELLTVSGLRKSYSAGNKFFSRRQTVRALDGIDLTVKANSVFALVGESGSGKSTAARLILRLEKPDEGQVLFKGKDVFAMPGESLKAYRRSVSVVFQDPFASLNPRLSVYTTLSEPLRIHRTVPSGQYRQKVAGLLASVGLQEDDMHKYPHEFSGGQRQRICIARALSLSPELIIADEPLSALDVSIQAQILNLLIDLKDQLKMSFLFISHDLRVVRYFSDETAVMYAGKIVERGLTDEIFAAPMHPYTKVLLASAPKIPEYIQGQAQDSKKAPWQSTNEETSVVAAPDTLNHTQVLQGCAFHPRCTRRLAICASSIPALMLHKGRLVACHIYNDSDLQ